jgi:hypothetical protein
MATRLVFLALALAAVLAPMARAASGPVLSCSNFSPAGGDDDEPDYEIRWTKESDGKYKVSIVGKDKEEFEKFIIQVKNRFFLGGFDDKNHS